MTGINFPTLDDGVGDAKRPLRESTAAAPVLPSPVAKTHQKLPEMRQNGLNRPPIPVD
jgi:hypothetical protein